MSLRERGQAVAPAPCRSRASAGGRPGGTWVYPESGKRPGRRPVMAELVPVTITAVVRERDDGPGRGERFSIALAAAAAGGPRRLRIGVGTAEATALPFSLQGQQFPRPITYQLMASLVDAA